MKMEFYAEGDNPICDICEDTYLRQTAPPEARWVQDIAHPEKTVVVQCCRRCLKDIDAAIATGRKVTNAKKVQ
jgi:hypothetical protein